MKAIELIGDIDAVKVTVELDEDDRLDIFDDSTNRLSFLRFDYRAGYVLVGFHKQDMPKDLSEAITFFEMNKNNFRQAIWSN